MRHHLGFPRPPWQQQEIAQLDGRAPAVRRDGVAQVQKAAERVAKGHDGAKAVRKEESATWRRRWWDFNHLKWILDHQK